MAVCVCVLHVVCAYKLKCEADSLSLLTSLPLSLSPSLPPKTTQPHNPHASQGIDTMVRDILMEAEKKKNIIVACNKVCQ